MMAGLWERDLWERAPPAKGSEAPGRIPETFLSREPAPGSGGPVQDRLWPGMAKVELTGMYSWRVLDGPTRSRCSLGDSKLPYLEGPGVL